MIPIVAAAGLVMFPWPGAVGEGIADEHHPPVARHRATGETAPQLTRTLQMLLTSDERRELVARLGALLQQGDIVGTKRLLEQAIEVGTLAVIMSDHVDDPVLSTWLRAMAVEKQAAPDPAPIPSSSNNGAADANGRRSTESDEALERERGRADDMLRQLHSAQEQLAVLQAHRADAGELKEALAREKQRASLLAHELETLNEQLSGLEASEAKLRDEYARAKEQGALTLRQLEAAVAEIAALKASARNTAAIEEALRLESEKTASAQRELQAVERQIAAMRDGAAFVPAALVFFQNPFAFPGSPVVKSQEGGERDLRENKHSAERQKAQQVRRSPDAGATNEATKAASRSWNPLIPPEEPRAARSRPAGAHATKAASNRNASTKVSRIHGFRAREAYHEPDVAVPDLPAALRPDHRLW
jgi:hypothetical protein